MSLLAFCCLAAAAGVATAGKLPPDIQRCERANPQLGECLRGAVESTLPKLKNGLPKLGLPALDPLYVKELRITQGGQGPLSFNLVLADLVTTGLLDGDKVFSAGINLDEMTIDASFLFPRAVASSNYTISGRILLLPVSGSGPSRVVLHNCTCVWRIKGKRTTKKDGKDYFDVQHVDLTMSPKKMEMQFDNLFGGDPQLGKTINRVVSENWQVVYNEIGPSFQEAYAEVIKQHTRSFLLHVPLDDLIPLKL